MAPSLPAARVQRELLATLATWGAVSTVVGTAVWRRGNQSAIRAFGRQTAAWGAVDLAIAGVGAWRSRTTTPSARQLRRTLLLNAGLDLGYIGGGLWWRSNGAAVHRRFGRYDPAAAPGDGSATAVQGAFLIALDAGFAARASQAMSASGRSRPPGSP